MEKEIYELLVKAKEYYISRSFYRLGMCFFIREMAIREGLIEEFSNYTEVYDLIPEFNPAYLGGSDETDYWWDLSDSESRIKAFDKLINLYAEKVKLRQAGE